jgi:phosphate-selective porin OprO/OprP
MPVGEACSARQQPGSSFQTRLALIGLFVLTQLSAAAPLFAQPPDRNPTNASLGDRLPAGSASIGLDRSGQTQTGSSIYDRIWRFADWYRNDANPIVQRVLFTGRFHHDFAVVDGDSGELRESNVRRLRLGPRITFFRSLTFHAEAEFNPQERDPLYVRLTDFYIQWTKSPRIVLTVGKHGVPFTLDGATSSKELLTIDRTNASNNMWFPQEYMPGVSVSGRRGRWSYRSGVYSAGAANREFGEFNGGAFALGVLGLDLAKTLALKEAQVAGHYVYQQPDPQNTFTRSLRHIASLNMRLESTKWGARAEVSAGAGYAGQSDLWSVTVMPFANLTEKLQAVGRYTFIRSDDPNGIRLNTYESRIVGGRGDRYRELYLGANYYFYGHKLKVQTGVQVPHMSDRASDREIFSGLSWTTGIRVGW